MIERFLPREDATLAAEVIRREIPGFTCDSIRLAQQGMDNFTFIVNEAWIFRFPRADWFRFGPEQWALKSLAGKTTLPIPVPEFVGGQMPFVAYRMLPGVKLKSLWSAMSLLEKEVCYAQLGEFIAEVHRAVDPAEAIAAGVRMTAGWEEVCDDVDSVIARGRLEPEWVPFIREVQERVRGYVPDRSWDRLIHQDLHEENVLLDPETKRVVAIIDFGDVTVDDLHIDFGITGWIDMAGIDRIRSEYERRTGLELDRRRAWDYYVLADTKDIDLEGLNCRECIAKCYRRWTSGNWP